MLRVERVACHFLVELLSIAHERGVEAEGAAALSCTLEACELPDIAAYRERLSAVDQAPPGLLPQRGPSADGRVN